MRVTNRHVKWGTPWLKLLLLLLLVPISVPAQDNPRELVVKMVQNELASQKEPRFWMYLDSQEKPGRTEVDRVIQTPECWVSWPVSVNGKPPTEREMSEARDHMESLVNDPRLRRKNRGEIDADSRKSAELLKMLPDVFLFTGDGRQGNSVRLKFRPNPKYRPPSNESKVFHHMEGILLIDAKQIRLAKLSGTLVSDVEFGFGILGKLQKGGTFEVVQSEVSPNDWEVSLLDVHISGRALFFHTIGEQQHEVKSQFEQVRPDLGVTEAAAILLCTGLSATDTLTMTDGTHHNGTLVSATSTSITFRERKTLHHYPKSSVQSIEMNTGVESSPALSRSGRASGSANNIEVPAGTEIAVLANQTIDSSTATAGQIFPADVAENVMDAAGRVVIPKGSLAELILRSASRGGVTSNAEMALDLQSIKVGNRRYVVNTADLEQKAQGGVGANKRTAEMVGGGAVLGTLIGAIAGGGKGAAIGAVAGAGAGAGTQVLTRGKTVKVPAETTLRFKLDQPLMLQAAY